MQLFLIRLLSWLPRLVQLSWLLRPVQLPRLPRVVSLARLPRLLRLARLTQLRASCIRRVFLLILLELGAVLVILALLASALPPFLLEFLSAWVHMHTKVRAMERHA